LTFGQDHLFLERFDRVRLDERIIGAVLHEHLRLHLAGRRGRAGRQPGMECRDAGEIRADACHVQRHRAPKQNPTAPIRLGSTVACLASASRAALKRDCMSAVFLRTLPDSSPRGLGVVGRLPSPYMSAMNAV